MKAHQIAIKPGWSFDERERVVGLLKEWGFDPSRNTKSGYLLRNGDENIRTGRCFILPFRNRQTCLLTDSQVVVLRPLPGVDSIREVESENVRGIEDD